MAVLTPHPVMTNAPFSHLEGSIRPLHSSKFNIFRCSTYQMRDLAERASLDIS